METKRTCLGDICFTTARKMFGWMFLLPRPKEEDTNSVSMHEVLQLVGMNTEDVKLRSYSRVLMLTFMNNNFIVLTRFTHLILNVEQHGSKRHLSI